MIKDYKRFVDERIKPGTIICVFDTETLGVEPHAKLIEFSGYRFSVLADGSLRPETTKTCYIDPEEPIPEKIQKITKLDAETLADRGAKPEREVAEEIFQFMQPADVWAAYNCNFDLLKLQGMAERTGELFHEKDCMDVLAMAKDRVPLILKKTPKSYKLQLCAEELLSEQEMETMTRSSDVDFHDAKMDVLVTAKILEKMIAAYRSSSELSIKPVVKRAYYRHNPYQATMVRISLVLEDLGADGDIFWDVLRGCWGSKATTAARKLKDSLDLADVERQVMRKYAWMYGHPETMKDLGKAWVKEKKAERKKKEKVQSAPIEQPTSDDGDDYLFLFE